MSKVTFDELLEEVKALPLDKQQRLRDLLVTWLTGAYPQSTEDEFEQKLYEAGLLSEIKPPIKDFIPYQDHKLVETKGKPLSEIIIEGRR
jgi:hypothetical protein